MSWSKRFRILWAALTQDWREHRCKMCAASWWSTKHNPEIVADLCASCEAKSFEQWVADFAARDERFKGAA